MSSHPATHCPAKHALGESQLTFFQPTFSRSIRVEARAERLSGDAGAVLLRELAEKLGYHAILPEALSDPRDPERVRHPFGELLLTDLLLRAQGWTDHSDATTLRQDPLLRLCVSERRGEDPVRPAGDSRVAEGLVEGRWRSEAIVDMDSLPIVVHGHQPGSAYNGHYRERPIREPACGFDGFGANEARWLLTLHAANLLPSARGSPMTQALPTPA